MFRPPFCPFSDCPSASHEVAFHWQRYGRYLRQCDGNWIQRFRCLACERGFSTQTFKSNYRYRIPYLHYRLLPVLASKVTRRQASRVFGVNRKTVERRFVRMARVCAAFHWSQLDTCQGNGGIRGVFQLDELETFEHNRKLKPVTMAVLIERRSYFVVQTSAGALPPRMPLSDAESARLIQIQAKEGRRVSHSMRCVQKSFRTLHRLLAPGRAVILQTDRKSSYPTSCKQATEGRRFFHQTTSSKQTRNYRNLLFPINHTLAMMRDGVSCLVRRSWGAAKSMRGLERHVAIWTVFRNYVRGVTNKTSTTPAQSAGVTAWAHTWSEVLRWRWPNRTR